MRRPSGLAAISAARSSGVIAPIRPRGGKIRARSTMLGAPSACSVETSASPTPSSVITSSTSSFGLGRKVSAAARTAFCSAGVKARSACCTRLPSWPSTVAGTSIGFWVTK